MKKKISLYKNAFDNVGQTVFMEDVLFDTKYKKKVEDFRKITDPDKKREAKLKKPMYTVSGVFSHRSKDGLLEHSGMICLDIDSKDNHGLNIDVIRSLDWVYYAGLSISGSGYFVIVSISNPDKHEYHFDALVRDFSDMGVKLDKSCRDVSRARFVSYDPEPYYNPKAEVYHNFLLPERSGRTYTDTGTNIERLARKTIDMGINITESYQDWFALACSLRNVPNGREIFHRLSAIDSRYNFERCDKQFTACLNGRGYDETKFFEICKRHNITLK